MYYITNKTNNYIIEVAISINSYTLISNQIVVTSINYIGI